jgi:hypothetical protein
MRAASCVFVGLVLSGCGGGAAPGVQAYSDTDGVLHVSGRHWTGCPRVEIRLPEPWGTSEAAVSKGGDFEARYATPLVKPYAGVVTAECVAPPQDFVSTRIEVRDRRSAAK